MYKNIEVLCHSSIRLCEGGTAYVDPFLVAGAPHDADVVFITHSHHDHFSPEDIAKVAKPETRFVLPASMRADFAASPFADAPALYVAPGETGESAGFAFETVAAYNVGKPMHPREKAWVGYIFRLAAGRVYVAGDTDDTPDARRVRCDIALVPVGGTYTTDAREAAALVNAIRPAVAIPTHYGSAVGDVACGRVFREHVDPGIEVVEELRF